MADLSIEFTGIKSPNPFWLASVPPTDKAYNVVRAYRAGWGGVVQKTLGKDPAAVNVSSCYSMHSGPNRQVQGIDNIELIANRSLEINLREIAQMKKDWPDRALIVSLMVLCVEESWKHVLSLAEATSADDIELSFGCPHGTPERGMDAAVSQVPEYVKMVTHRCKTHCLLPVIVKLIPNITDVRQSACAARRGGADMVSLINTINPITSIDLGRMVALPVVGAQSTHNGYYGPAVKPIALNMVAEIVRDPQTRGLPICGVGSIGSWCGVAEFVALSYGAVQVCAAAVLHGSRIVGDVQDGLVYWMGSHGCQWLSNFSGDAVGDITDWRYLDINYQVIARIDQDACIGCGRCHITCEGTSHQATASLPRVNGAHRYEVIDAKCTDYNLYQIACSVRDCIEMAPQDTGKPYLNWIQDPYSPYREAFWTQDDTRIPGERRSAACRHASCVPLCFDDAQRRLSDRPASDYHSPRPG